MAKSLGERLGFFGPQFPFPQKSGNSQWCKDDVRFCVTRMLQDVAFKALGQILPCGGREKRDLTLVPFFVVMAIGKKKITWVIYFYFMLHFYVCLCE